MSRLNPGARMKLLPEKVKELKLELRLTTESSGGVERTILN